MIVVSDGWDRGDPALVAAETARLRRNCHRLVWLNPLASAPGYQPLAAGMKAAYPFIDDFLPAGTAGQSSSAWARCSPASGAGTARRGAAVTHATTRRPVAGPRRARRGAAASRWAPTGRRGPGTAAPSR